MNVASPSCKCNPTMLRGGDDGAEASETARRIFEVWRGEALHLGPDPLPGVPSMADLAVLSACHTTLSVWDSLHHNRMHHSISPSISFDFPALYLGYLGMDQVFPPLHFRSTLDKKARNNRYFVLPGRLSERRFVHRTVARLVLQTTSSNLVYPAPPSTV